MKIGGENRLAWIRQRHLLRLAEQAGLKGSYALEMFDSMAFRMISESKTLQAECESRYGQSPLIAEIVNGCETQRGAI